VGETPGRRSMEKVFDVAGFQETAFDGFMMRITHWGLSIILSVFLFFVFFSDASIQFLVVDTPSIQYDL
jgi:hypothetical protein